MLLAFGSIGWNINAVAEQLVDLPRRSNFDLLSSEIVEYGRAHPGSGRIVSFNAPDFALHESTYGGMLHSLTINVSTQEELLKLAGDKQYSFFVTGLQEFKSLFPVKPVAAYHYFAPFYDRKQWLVFFTYDENIHLAQLTTAARNIKFNDKNFTANYGSADRTSINGFDIRRMQGDELSIPIEGDPALKAFGSVVKLNFSVSTDDPITVSLKLNTDEIASKQMTRSNFRTMTAIVPPGIWMDGTNTIYLTLKRLDGTSISGRSTPILLNWMSVHPGAEDSAAQEAASGNSPAIEK